MSHIFSAMVPAVALFFLPDAYIIVVVTKQSQGEKFYMSIMTIETDTIYCAFIQNATLYLETQINAYE